MQTPRSSSRACAKALATSSRFSGRAMAKTRAELSWPWTSLTRIVPGAALVAALGAWASCAKEALGAAAASPAAFRNVRLLRFFSSDG
ncbi:hypothetical protein AYO46_00380 [Betaproteobacteria bacterium SCGC AG-212-J23]|nr:hypothetical protein AYO46_00380 [Betaproteobacteria bacterium SCGC AG-212-J23]